MDVKKHHQKSNFFVKWFLNNRFSIALLNILLFFLIILVFNQISFVLNPFWTFFNAIFPPILVASIQYYLMDPVVDWMEKKLKVPRIITIILLFVIVVGGLIWIINTLIPIIQHQTDSLVKNWPTYWKDAQKGFEKMIRDPRLNGVRGGINQAISDAQTKMFKTGQDSFNLALSNLSSAVNVITMIFMTLLTAPFVLFFMLKDGHRLNPYVTKFAPKKLQPKLTTLEIPLINSLLSVNFVKKKLNVNININKHKELITNNNPCIDNIASVYNIKLMNTYINHIPNAIIIFPNNNCKLIRL